MPDLRKLGDCFVCVRSWSFSFLINNEIFCRVQPVASFGGIWVAMQQVAPCGLFFSGCLKMVALLCVHTTHPIFHIVANYPPTQALPHLRSNNNMGGTHIGAVTIKAAFFTPPVAECVISPNFSEPLLTR